MIPIVVLASGRGSNFDAIRLAIQSKRLDAEIRAVVSDREDAGVLSKASQAGIPSILVPFPSLKARPVEERRREHEAQILEKIMPYQPRFLVMAGYMRIVTPYFIEAFRCDRGYSRMVNIHPSLLPAFPGVQAYSQAFRYGVQVAGATVHLVEAEVDTGPICAQEAFSISDCRSEIEVEQKGLAVEHRLYPQTLSWVLAENFQIEKREQGRLCVRTS